MTSHSLSLPLSLLLLTPLLSPAAQAADTRRIAIVVGVGDHANLPDTLDIPTAAADARAVAESLEKRAGYDQVHLLVDAAATRGAIQDLVKLVAPKINPKDTVLFYFVGQGLGADFEDPFLLPYDVDPNRIQDTAFGVKPFAASLKKALNPGLFVLVTDVVHPGELNGLAMTGPHARSWPEVGPKDWFVLSSTSQGEKLPCTPFARHFIAGVEGAADTNADKQVSANELHAYVLDQVVRETNGKVHPMEGGKYKPEDMLAWPGQVRNVATIGGAQVEMSDAKRLSEKGQKNLRLAGYASLGGAALLAGTSGLYLLKVKNLQPKYFGSQEIEPGETWKQVKDDYSQAWWAHTTLLAGAGLLAATGGTLLLIPTAQGPSLGFHTAF